MAEAMFSRDVDIGDGNPLGHVGSYATRTRGGLSAKLRLDPEPTFANATARAITKNTATMPSGTSGSGGALRLRFAMAPASDCCASSRFRSV